MIAWIKRWILRWLFSGDSPRYIRTTTGEELRVREAVGMALLCETRSGMGQRLVKAVDAESRQEFYVVLSAFTKSRMTWEDGTPVDFSDLE